MPPRNGLFVALDIDDDHRIEIVAGQRGGERSLIRYTPSANGETWTRRVLDEGGMAGAGGAPHRHVCIGSATANLEGDENVGKRSKDRQFGLFGAPARRVSRKNEDDTGRGERVECTIR